MEKDIKDKILNQFFELSKSISMYFSTETNTNPVDEITFISKIFKEYFYSFKFFREQILERFRKYSNENSKEFTPLNNYKTSYEPFNISIKRDIVKIEIPLLISKKVYQKTKDSNGFVENYYTSYVIDSNLYSALQTFIQENKLQKFTEKYMVYILNEEKITKNKKVLTDTDNHEYQVLINTLTAAFFSDDGSEFICHLHDSKVGKENKTTIYLLPYKEFEKVLQEKISKI